MERRDKDYDIYADDFSRDERRTFQDDLSLAVYRDTIYVMDEETKSLNMFRY
jgi:hypothetical protein